jgi:hypothetical protein
VPTPDLMAWVMGEAPLPQDRTTPLLQRMIDFHLNAPRE